MKIKTLLPLSFFLCFTITLFAQQVQCIRACNELFDRDLSVRYTDFNRQEAKNWLYDYFRKDISERKQKKKNERTSFGIAAVVDGIPLQFSGSTGSDKQSLLLSSISEEALRVGYVSDQQLELIIMSFIPNSAFQSYNNCLEGCGGATNNKGVRLIMVERTNDIIVLGLTYEKPNTGIDKITIKAANYTNGIPLHSKKFKEGLQIASGQTIFEQIKIDEEKEFLATVDFMEPIGDVPFKLSPDRTRGKDDRMPIGAIVASYLTYDQFLEVNKYKKTNQLADVIWVPCDGRSVTGSQYTSFGGGDKAPDLRGVFLRSVNEYHVAGTSTAAPIQLNPESKMAGEFQDDMLESHTHGISGNDQGCGGCRSSLSGKGAREDTTDSDPTGGAETRPKNISVYYYVKIN